MNVEKMSEEEARELLFLSFEIATRFKDEPDVTGSYRRDLEALALNIANGFTLFPFEVATRSTLGALMNAFSLGREAEGLENL